MRKQDAQLATIIAKKKSSFYFAVRACIGKHQFGETMAVLRWH